MATIDYLQLESSIRISDTLIGLDTSDVSLQVESLTIITERTVVTAAPTFGLAQDEDLGGPIKHTVGMRYRQGLEGTSLGMLFWDTAQESDPVLWAAARFKEGASGPANPEFVFQFRVMSATVGGDPGTLRVFDSVFPVVAGTLEKFIVPVS